MSTASNTMTPPARAAEPTVVRPAGSPWRVAVAVLSPAAAAVAALAVHQFVPNEQLPPLTWVEALPAWQHPYPVILAGILIYSLALATAQVMWPFPRAWARHSLPLVAAGTLVLCGWELITAKWNWLAQPFFPGPDEVFGGILDDRKILALSAWHSLVLLAAGYLTGVTAGLVTGILVGWYPRVRYWVMPVLKILGPTPATALIPLVMTIWKESFLGSASLIAFAVWFPVTMLTSSGISNVRQSYLDVARTLGASRFYLIFRVAVPAALPTIFVGLFIGLGTSFLTLIAAEALGVEAGLGWYLKWQQGYMDYGKVYGALVVTAVFFSTIMTLLFKLRDRVLRWQEGVIKW
ncbi:ABC transporter permease [Fimbriiglobus ruber]|uniref:Alkanesulfonates transport system permease protein n=1 Tax=Fimbriiglobus ruber TaxID=1908690 RepID=A0A225D9L0_9BACT|nr:ABC transporter permease subunit [Fimbriiglobus ruber]OWK38300.1 Alkanesulfonates transport system permease protein [Fimbriiglobus ruber]